MADSEQRRKLALLEARLQEDPETSTTPVTPAPTSALLTTPAVAPQPPPVSIGSLSASSLDSAASAATQPSPQSSALLPPSLPTPRTNAHRNYAPPPLPREAKGSASASTAAAAAAAPSPTPPSGPTATGPPDAADTPSLRTRPAMAPTPTAPRKRRRTGTSSPNTMRNSRVDAYFKPRSRDSSKDCVPLSERFKQTPSTPSPVNGPDVVAAAAAKMESISAPPSTHALPTPSPPDSAAAVKRTLSFVSPGNTRDPRLTPAQSAPRSRAEGGNTPPSASSARSMAPAALPSARTQVNTCSSLGNADDYRHLRAMIESLKEEAKRIPQLEAQVQKLETENEDLQTQVSIELPILREQASVAAETESKNKVLLATMRNALRHAVVSTARLQRAEARRTVASLAQRVGRLGVERSRTQLQEVWEEGEEWKIISEKVKKIQAEREAIDKKKRELAKLKKKASEEKDAKRFELTPAYVAEQEEVYRVQLQVLKKEENMAAEQKLRLGRERDCLVRELRRQSDEDISEFNKFPTVNERYVVLNLLGRGGFSEVFKAFDLTTGQFVACKIHQLGSHWSEVKKRNFIRHAMREYEIHKQLRHPRVVQLVDIFEIDENTFCTVLEFCEGSDLDSHLRMHQTLPEREARSIISQVVSGLVYLSEQEKRIIHYDLKPGNILFSGGEARITDFGLSKIMGESDTTQMGMELTSVGAGTMWYLPPECFDMEAAGGPRINGKVDVWSTGVILFQMLFGRKPFGHDQSQEKMFREKTVAYQQLKFPQKPVVTEQAKAFIASCLTRDVNERPNVQQLAAHPFLKRK